MLSRSLIALLATGASLLLSESALAQRATATACVISSRLLNRIAAAVDGYNRGERVWVVTTCNDTASVIATATSESEARRRGTATALILGTYGARMEQAARDLGMHLPPYLYIDRQLYCWHEEETSVMRPGHCDFERMPLLADVASILVRFQLRNGQTMERPLPTNADVLFLKYSSLEKFAFPYYQRILGLTGVVEMRAEMFGRTRR